MILESRGGERKEKKKEEGRSRKKKKEKKEGRREGRRGDPRNLMSIGPSNLSRSISNFDITLYLTPETTEWSPMEISMVGFS